MSLSFSTGSRHFDHHYGNPDAINPGAFNATAGSDYQVASGRLD